jgi:hypothetical protein
MGRQKKVKEWDESQDEAELVEMGKVGKGEGEPFSSCMIQYYECV